MKIAALRSTLSEKDLGQLDRFGEQERAVVLAVFRVDALTAVETALGLPGEDLELRNELAYLAWRAIGGRCKPRESRKQA